MQGSYFGHYFARKVNLPLYKRNRYDWKDRQARGVGGTPAELRAQQHQAAPTQRQHAPVAVQAPPAPSAPATEQGDAKATSKKRRKAKAEEPDEIDQIFGTSSAKRGRLDAGVVA